MQSWSSNPELSMAKSHTQPLLPRLHLGAPEVTQDLWTGPAMPGSSPPCVNPAEPSALSSVYLSSTSPQAWDTLSQLVATLASHPHCLPPLPPPPAMGTEQAGPEPERKFAITRGGGCLVLASGR